MQLVKSWPSRHGQRSPAIWNDTYLGTSTRQCPALQSVSAVQCLLTVLAGSQYHTAVGGWVASRSGSWPTGIGIGIGIGIGCSP